MTPSPLTAPALCIVVLREMLIAHDLSLMIADARPDLVVKWSATHEDALLHLEDGGHVVMALIAPPPHAFSPTDLAARIARDGGMVVFLGYDKGDDPMAEAADQFISLPYPFGLADVLGVLDRLPKKHSPRQCCRGLVAE